MDTNKTYMIVLLGLILNTSYIQTAFAVHKPYWSPSNINVGPEFMEYHFIVYGIDTTFSNGVIRACVQTGCLSVIGNDKVVCNLAEDA